MNRNSTIFLRIAICFIGLVVLALSVFVLPVGIIEDSSGYRPIIIGMYITAIPFFIALYQALRLLGYIDKNKAFSFAAVRTLRYIKYCALIISGIYAFGLPYIYLVADRDDAPGVVVIGLTFAFVPLIIGVFAGVLQKLLQNAATIKSENDLTV